MKQNNHVKVVFIEDTDEKLSLTVTVGLGQPSHTDIYKNGAIIHKQDNSFNYPVDTKTNLIGKEILVITTASDIPANPNQIEVAHEWNTDKPNSTSTFQDNVSENEVVINSTRYFFYKK